MSCCPAHNNYTKRNGIMLTKLTTEYFVKMAITVHGDRYDYSKVIYINAYTNVRIICRIHGEFLQNPDNHIRGHGCSKCSGNKKTTVEEFIINSIRIHGDRYDYSKVVYANNHTNVIIICPIHGEFLQTPNAHLIGHGCQKCGKSKKLTAEEFINRAKIIYENKYDYSKVVYINSLTDVIIICPIHGEYSRKPIAHLNGNGCPKCYGERNGARKYTVQYFIEIARKVHGNYYDYSKIIYVNSLTAITIICPIHGEFPQTPGNHLRGQGCPICQSSHGERLIAKILDDNKIQYVRQKKFVDCINPKTKHRLRYDFLVLKYNMLVEYNVAAHYILLTYYI